MDEKLRSLLFKSCDKMRDYSKNCTHDRVDNDSCDWYHSAWQYLRAVDCVSAPQWHEQFYTEAFSKVLSKKKQANVLISGTADYSMLHIWVKLLSQSSFKDNIVNLDILDKCNTPLCICNWYVENVDVPSNLKINTLCDDLLFYADMNPDKYDVICSDAFLTRFPNNRVHSVLTRWNAMLKKDGKIITTVRISNKDADGQKDNLYVWQNKIHQFIGRVTDSYNDLKGKGFSFSMPERDLQFIAFQYIVKMESHPIGTAEDIGNVFEKAQFGICKGSRIDEVKGEISETKYYRVIAEKINQGRNNGKN